MTETKREIPGLSPASIKMDLLHFKDEILKDIRTVQLTLDDKYLKVDDFIKERLEHFELKINSFSKKIAELSNLIVTDTTIREKVESFEQFKEEIRDTIFKRRAKFSELEKKVNDDIDRINHILTDSVIYPSLIGNATKFKNFHEFMDYVVQEISQLNLFKDKSGLDITPYKRKIDQTVETLKLQINSFVSKDLLDNAINKSEDNIKHILKIYDDRLQDTRVENSHYSFGLEKKAKEISKQMENLQKAFNKKLEKNKFNEGIFNEYNKELTNINTRLDKMNEILKELLGYHPASKKIFMPEIEKKSSKIYSGVKQYIKGNLNANELTSMKKFTYEKSKTKCFDKSYPSPTTSPFPSEDLIKYKNNDYQKKNSNSNFLSNNYMPISLNSQISSESNNRIERKKTFMTQKSFNNSNLRDSLTKKFSEIEDNINFKNENNDKIFKKNTFIRKRTYNYEKVKSTELSKKNVEGNKEYEDNKNFNKDNEDDLSDSFLKDANIDINNNNNKDKLVLNDYNQNAIKKCSTSIKKVTNNQFIIKEEDEYILSDASCKNGELNSTKRTQNNQSFKNNSEEENENKNRNNNISGIKDNSNDNKESKNKSKNNNISGIKDMSYDNKENKNNNNTINNSNSNDNKENISNNNSNNNDNKEKKNISNNNPKNNDNKENNTYNNSNTNDKSINNIVNEVINESIVNNDDSKTKPDINNSEEKKKVLNLSKSDNSDLKRLQSLKDKLNPENNCYSNNNTNNANTNTNTNNANTNTNNIGIQLLTIKRKINNVDVNNNNKLIIIENNNNDKIVCKNVEQKNNQDLKLLTKLGDIQRPYHLQPVNFGMRENISHKNINHNNSKFSPKTARTQNQNFAYFLQNSNQKIQNGPNFNSLDSNNIRNNNPQNYNFKPNYNNNIIAIHKVNRTYNNFPKINQDLSEKRNINNTNCVEVKDMNIISKTLSAAKIPNQGTNNKVAAYIQKPKKILLTSPDNLPPNAFIRKKNRNIAKNNSFGLNGEKNDNNNKRLKNLYNNNINY